MSVCDYDGKYDEKTLIETSTRSDLRISRVMTLRFVYFKLVTVTVKN